MVSGKIEDTACSHPHSIRNDHSLSPERRPRLSYLQGFLWALSSFKHFPSALSFENSNAQARVSPPLELNRPTE